MGWPTSQEYNEAIQNPQATLDDAELRAAEAVCNALGIPMPCSGNFADVYQVRNDAGKSWAVKCFTRETPGLRERYSEISNHLAQVRLPFAVDFQYLDNGIRIAGHKYPLLKMRWVDGLLLNQFVREQADRKQHLEALRLIWLKMARDLRDANVAHADLQHGNVILVPSSKGSSLSVKLIDYDGMFVPALAQRRSNESGHPAYQHPQRLREGIYSADVDRFPLLAIYCALRAVELGGRSLWERHDTGDNLLFREHDHARPGQSTLYRELWQTSDAFLHDLLGHLVLAASMPLVETPPLDRLAKHDESLALTPEQEARVAAILGPPGKVRRVVSATPARPAPVPAPAAVFAGLDSSTSTPRRRPSGMRAAGAMLAIAAALMVFLVGGASLWWVAGRAPDGPPIEKVVRIRDTSPAVLVPEEKPRELPKEEPKAAVKEPAKELPKEAPKELPKAAQTKPLQLRITVNIDGRDSLWIGAKETIWVHHSWRYPDHVKLNERVWNPRSPSKLNNGMTHWLGAEVDLATAKMTKVRGRGPVRFDATKQRLQLEFDDEGPGGADTYEVVLTFPAPVSTKANETTKASEPK